MTKNAGKKYKFFIFSDESGSWHICDDVYIRSWVVILDKEYNKLVNKLQETAQYLGANELKWKTIAGNTKFFDNFDGINFRVFITISSPGDINWLTKYSITRDFESSMSSFNFGEIDGDLKDVLKKKMFDDIKNVLFLYYYERFHIENATKRIEQIIKPEEYELIYRIDPPQMSKDGWATILSKITDKKLEFPKSSKDFGIQFADIVAGCFRSLIVKDERYESACIFFKRIKSRFIHKNTRIPNPNLIFYSEINKTIKRNIIDIWKISIYK